MFSFTKFRHKYDFNECFYSFSQQKQFKMLSDFDILNEFDNMLATEESGDEFLDDLCFDDDDSDTLASPPLSHKRAEIIPSFYDNVEQDLPGTSKTTNVFLEVPVAQNVTPILEPNMKKKNI